jgi:predicted nuclease of predicted toxin-antitoxin system
MRLLFDQNISYRIVNRLKDYFPDCKHISQVGLIDSEDTEIWSYAREQDYIIVTFDSDFYDISLMNGFPPKIIWLRSGNLTTNEIASLLIANRDTISDFINNPEQKDLTCLEID